MLIVQPSVHATFRTYNSTYAQIEAMCRAAALHISCGRRLRKRCASQGQVVSADTRKSAIQTGYAEPVFSVTSLDGVSWGKR